MGVNVPLSGREVTNRWPQIGRFLWVSPTGWVENDSLGFLLVEDTLNPADRAAAYEEWADFYEFRLEQRADELTRDHHKRNLVATWTNTMAYCYRRCAAVARGEDPGEWVPLRERRPDLDTAARAIVAEIIAGLDTHRQPAGTTTAQDLRKAG